MPVEKMNMISTVGYIDDIDRVSEEMVKCGCVHIINAMEDISSMSREYGEEDSGIIVKPYINLKDYTKLKEQLNEIMEILNMDKVIKKKYIEQSIDLEDVSLSIAPIYKKVSEYKSMLEKSREELVRVMELKNSIENIEELKFALRELRGLSYFKFRIGKLHRAYYIKLKENIENIPSIVYKVSSRKDYVVIVTFTPLSTEDEAEGIFKSLGFEEIIIPESVRGIPLNVEKGLCNLIEERQKKINGILENILSVKQEYGEFIETCFSGVEKYDKTQEINSQSACTNNVFYISGWIPSRHQANYTKRLETFEEKLVSVVRKGSEINGLTPPTKLINKSFVKPFEFMVNMYGIPSYNEVDPTSFVAISYMVMFGAMFGDVGQGFVLLIIGLYLSITMKILDF